MEVVNISFPFIGQFVSDSRTNLIGSDNMASLPAEFVERQVTGPEFMLPGLDNMMFYSANSNSEEDSVPSWALILSTVILFLTVTIGIPLNGATILIFIKCKKLRHLVNFILLLDCVAHLLLTFTAVPIQLIAACNRLQQQFNSGGVSANATDTPNNDVNANGDAKDEAIGLIKHVMTSFTNLVGLFCIVTIAVLRYRRLCWKKKDRLSICNGIKWGIVPTAIVIGFITVEAMMANITPQEQRTTSMPLMFILKFSAIIFLILTAIFCYIRVSQRIWLKTSTSSQDGCQSIDLIKLKKSRNVHLRATIHSAIQILLLIVTIALYLYEETGLLNDKQQEHKFRLQQQVAHSMSQASSSTLPAVPSDGFKLSLFEHVELTSSSPAAAGDEKVVYLPTFPSPIGVVGLTLNGVDNKGNQRQLVARLLASTFNYSLLILGTPTAYIASCHRFRDQFHKILFNSAIGIGLHYLFPISATGTTPTPTGGTATAQSGRHGSMRSYNRRRSTTASVVVVTTTAAVNNPGSGGPYCKHGQTMLVACANNNNNDRNCKINASGVPCMKNTQAMLAVNNNNLENSTPLMNVKHSRKAPQQHSKRSPKPFSSSSSICNGRKSCSSGSTSTTSDPISSTCGSPGYYYCDQHFSYNRRTSSCKLSRKDNTSCDKRMRTNSIATETGAPNMK